MEKLQTYEIVEHFRGWDSWKSMEVVKPNTKNIYEPNGEWFLIEETVDNIKLAISASDTKEKLIENLKILFDF